MFMICISICFARNRRTSNYRPGHGRIFQEERCSRRLCWITSVKAIILSWRDWMEVNWKKKWPNKNLREFTGNFTGSTIRKILSTIQSKKSPKLNLYSAHENNVAGLLYLLNLWDYSIPQFSSAVLFEHHEVNSKKFIKVVYNYDICEKNPLWLIIFTQGLLAFKVIYYRGIPSVFKELTIPGCATLCPLEDFLNITADYIPDNPVEECFGPITNTTLVPKGVDPIQWIYDQIKNWYSF